MLFPDAKGPRFCCCLNTNIVKLCHKTFFFKNVGLFLYEFIIFLDTQNDVDKSNTNYYHEYTVII